MVRADGIQVQSTAIPTFKLALVEVSKISSYQQHAQSVLLVSVGTRQLGLFWAAGVDRAQRDADGRPVFQASSAFFFNQGSPVATDRPK
jgi:hypothetical protein